MIRLENCCVGWLETGFVLGAGWVVLIEVAVVVAFETLKLCTPTLGALTPWLEIVVFVVFDRDVPLENPV